MNSKELVSRTLNFESPQRIPVDVWIHPASRTKYGTRLENLLRDNPIDFARADYNDPFGYDRLFTKGTFTDPWGCVWNNLCEGIMGEVKHSPLAEARELGNYRAPLALVDEGYENVVQSIKQNSDKFILACAPQLDPFERMQYLRGVENFLVDIAEESKIFFQIKEMMFDFVMQYVRNWLRYDVDAVIFSDDWGSQQSMLISPEAWRKYFKFHYRELFEIIHRKGKYVFFHSDGNIIDIYPDLIEIGVDALNSQLFVIGLDKIEAFRGQITFWGEMDRQKTFTFGRPDEVEAEAKLLKQACFDNGGCIAVAEFGADTPFENMTAYFRAWKI
ncbi:MAG: uroporphyrinogen decarboxylase family protein [Planctomycetota bacterium]